MTSRRGGRPTHVRPRPPSTGRPAANPVRSRAPAPGRLTKHRPIDRGGRLPIPIRLVLAVAVVALSAGVLYVGAGGLSRVAATVGSSLTGFVDDLVATPSPSPSLLVVSDAPAIEQPGDPYTNEAAIDLVVTIPRAVIGDDAHRIRVFQQLKDQAPVPIGEWPVGLTQRLIVPVELEKGINDFSAIVVGPAGNSESSPMVRYVLDTAAPKITITSPKANARVNHSSVTIKGKTQGRSTIVARNGANDASISVAAGSDGTFELSLPLARGTNPIALTATDVAGNTGEGEITVRRGTGKLTVVLSADTYRFKRSRLPRPIVLTATVTDPDGRPLADAAVTFTVSIPGIAAITHDTTTNSRGRASFETSIPRSATVGQGLAAVLARTSAFGSVDDRTVITIVK